MTEAIAEALGNIPDRLVVVILSMLPISELRGAILWGAKFAPGIGAAQRYLLAVAANMVPVVPLLLGLQPLTRKVQRWPLVGRLFDWFFERTRRRARVVERYEAIGLILFVAIPLPVTGAWTGCVAASLFGIRLRYAVPAIALGVAIAGVVMSAGVALWGWGVERL